MPYTRRSFVRDAAVLSAGGVLGASAIALYKKQTQVDAPLVITPYSGIRIVFAGSWLFCGSPKTPGWMRAITLDMDQPSHHFPYGAWRASGFDAPAGVLAADTRPYTLTLVGNTMQPNPVDKLFEDTLSMTTFTYLPNPMVNGAPTYQINPGKLPVRIISLPIPSEIIPTAFLSKAKVGDPSNVLQTTQSQYSANGVPTCHIFDYPAATSLSFAGPDNAVLDSAELDPNNKANPNLHYHFHTVPGKDHDGKEMFDRLQKLLNVSPKLTLANYDPPYLLPGTLPADVCEEELDLGRSACTMPNDQFSNRNLHTDAASCAGGALGLGGDCGC
jgi:hypothetical protein